MKNVEMDCPDGHTLEHHTPSFLVAATNLDNKGAKTVHARWIEGWFEVPLSGKRQVGHEGNFWATTPFSALHTLPLVSADGFTAS